MCKYVSSGQILTVSYPSLITPTQVVPSGLTVSNAMAESALNVPRTEAGGESTSNYDSWQ